MEFHIYLFLSLIHTLYIGAEATLRILGGRDALEGEFPFAVRLERKVGRSNKIKNYERFCTGAAVTSTWILTAAHCYSKEDYENHIKQYARYNSYYPKNRGQLSLLLEFHIHPSYDDLLPNNDIALFRCEKLAITLFVKISALDYTSFIGREAIILGFGGTNASALDKPLQVLKGMFTKCTQPENAKYMSCIVPLCEVVATICGGDSGGPVLLSSHVVGVNSASEDDCDEDTVYMKRTPGTAASIVAMVSPYIDWMRKVISNKTNSL